MQTAIDGVLTNYQVLGTDRKNQLLILHGWGQNIAHWQEVGKQLSKNFEVFLIDLPGFGDSSNPDDDWNSTNYTDFILKFIDKLNLQNITLIGHSFGGKIAIKIAVKSNDVKTLVLISPSGIDEKSLLTRVKIVLAKIFRHSLFFLPTATNQKLFNLFAANDYLNSGNMKNIYKNIINENAREDAKKISIPTVILWGEKDGELHVQNSKLLKSYISKSNLHILWGLGHSPNIESPNKLVSAILENI